MNVSAFYKSREAGIYFLLLLCTLFMVAELINDRFWLSDLEVYYRTAGRLWEGNNLYRYAEDKHYVFKYSPVSAAYFIPFLLLPFTLAKILYWLMLSVIIALVFQNTIYSVDYSLINTDYKTRFNNLVLIAGVLFAVHYLRELHLGQVNFILLACYVWVAILLEKGKSAAGGLLIAATIFLKPFGLIFIPYLILVKRYREIAWIALGLFLFSWIPILFYRDTALFADQYVAWINELKIELGNKQSLFKPGNHTLFSVIARYTPIGYLIEEGTSSQKIYQMLVLGLTGIITALYIRKKIPADKVPVAAIYDVAFLTALIPLLSFTSENAFLFTLPAALILLVNWKNLSTLLKITTASGLLLVGGNFSELTGKKLSQWLDDWSVLTPGTVLLLVVLFILKEGQSNRGTEGQRDKGTEGQRDRGTEGQRDKGRDQRP
jgi:hypothetical protein